MRAMGSQPPAAKAAWLRWRWLAVGLATVAVVVFVLGAGGRPALGDPGVVSWIVVPAVGVWLTARRDGPRTSLGLSTLAAWGMVFHAPALLMMPLLVVAEPPGGDEWVAALLALGWRGLPVVVAVVALLALRARGDRYVLGFAGRRRAAALGIALWGLAGIGVLLVGLDDWAVLSPDGGMAVILFGGMVVLLAVAAVVWRRDRLTVVPAVLVVTVHALMTLVQSLVSHPPAPGTPYPTVGAFGVVVQTAALAVLMAAAVRLTLAASRRPGRLRRHGRGRVRPSESPGGARK